MSANHFLKTMSDFRHADDIQLARQRLACDDAAEFMRAKCEKIARDIAAKYCHIVSAGEVADSIADAIAATAPPTPRERPEHGTEEQDDGK